MVRDYVLPHCYHSDAITYLVHHNYDNHSTVPGDLQAYACFAA